MPARIAATSPDEQNLTEFRERDFVVLELIVPHTRPTLASEDDVHVLEAFFDERLKIRVGEPLRQNCDDVGVLEVVAEAADHAAALAGREEAVAARPDFIGR